MSEDVQACIALLKADMEVSGPLRFNWKNFGKLKGSGSCYHCHVQSGRPTYVVCWEITDKKVQIVEIYYVGTHEKAPIEKEVEVVFQGRLSRRFRLPRSRAKGLLTFIEQFEVRK